MHRQILQKVEEFYGSSPMTDHISFSFYLKLLVKSIGRKHPNPGTLKFHLASQQQQAGPRALGTAPRFPLTTLAAQSMRSCPGKLSETVWGGPLVGTTSSLKLILPNKAATSSHHKQFVVPYEKSKHILISASATS